MTLAAAAYQGGLLLSQGEQRKAHFDHFRRRLDLCQYFGIPTMLVVADFAGAIDQPPWGRAVVSLKQAAQWAAGFGVRLALEFRGSATFCTSLDTALALVRQCGEPNVGVSLDVFHYYTGPSKSEDLDRLTPQNLAHVQVCDLAGVPRSWRPTPTASCPARATSAWSRSGPAARHRLRRLGVAGGDEPDAVAGQARRRWPSWAWRR